MKDTRFLQISARCSPATAADRCSIPAGRSSHGAAKLNAEVVAATGNIPENINFAIKPARSGICSTNSVRLPFL